MGRVTRRVPRTRWDLHQHPAGVITHPDTVVVEEPLEIRVGGTSVTTTMRTPGDDFDLAVGHLLAEGLLRSAGDVRTIMHCTDLGPDGAPTFNVVDLTLAPGAALLREPAHRTSVTSSACGVCGKQSIDDVLAHVGGGVGDDNVSLTPESVVAMVAELRSHQKVFERTGGIHAAGLFTPEGVCRVVREDVGRHNAVDKVIGWAAREGALPLSGQVLVVSSRAGFEIVLKAVAAGVPVVVAVSAATSLAIELATETGLTLVAFARQTSLAAYARPDRLLSPTADISGPLTGQ
jgi:FdhD protein